MNCKRITAYLLSAIVAFSVCMPAFGSEDAQTPNAEVTVNEEEPALQESADGTEEPDSEDLLEEPNAAEEQPAEEQPDEEQPAWT